jgi:hypothetical protein
MAWFKRSRSAASSAMIVWMSKISPQREAAILSAALPENGASRTLVSQKVNKLAESL